MISENGSQEVSRSPQNVPETTYVSTLLFHGAAEPFHFRPDFGFDNPANDGSRTLGEGIYLTDKIDHALDYSQVRQQTRVYKPTIYSVSAEQCKFLDFRGEKGNLPVTDQMVVKWRDFFKVDLARQIQAKPDLGSPRFVVTTPGSNIDRRKINLAHFERENLKKYLTYLDELVDTHRKVDVRELLGTTEVNWTQTEFSGNEVDPQWSRLFRTFMTDVMEFDGLIYLEAAEGELGGTHPSFIVYNLDSIHFSQTPVDFVGAQAEKDSSVLKTD